MANAEELLSYITSLFETDGIGADASTVAEHFGIWRNDAVAVLSGLVSQGKLMKSNGRPARYLPAAAAEAEADDARARANARSQTDTSAQKGVGVPADSTPPFAHVIGYNGSLKFQVQLASAAASYPPHGVHTLLVGETGVGKSLMASEMARYLWSVSGKTAEESPFVTFNCAEYADNPQLLLSQLFGYMKGAFTGADQDRAGLIEKADGGILFLDEIHRLPATGQEMLFTVVDKGLYRRMGDTVDRTAHFMIIGATTENPSNFLLGTFKRRMPLTIQIPLLSERPINERLDLLSLFLHEESRQLSLPIHVSYLALKLLASFRGENNIGDLKNEIRIACARGFLEREQKRAREVSRPYLNIDIYHLSRKLSVNYIADDRVDRFFSAVGLENGLEVRPDRPPSFSPREEGAGEEGPGGQPRSFADLNGDPAEAGWFIVSDLERQYTDNPAEILYGSITPAIWRTANQLIQRASAEFGKTYKQSMVNSIAYYLQQLKAYAGAGRIIFSPTNFDSVKLCSREKAFVHKMAPFLSNQLNIDIMDGELTLLSMLLTHEQAFRGGPSRNLLLVGYGDIASHTAAFVNELLNVNFIKAFDLDDVTDVDTIGFRLANLFDNNFSDTLILSGLGISSVLEHTLKDTAKFHYRILSGLDPMLVMECGRILLTTDSGVDEIAESVAANLKNYFKEDLSLSVPPCVSAEPWASEDKNSSADMRDVIITYCVTGTGSARIARKLLLKNFTVSSSADILSLGIMDNIFSIASRLGSRLKLIIGIMNPNIPGVPFVSIERILYSSNPDELLRKKGVHIPTEADLEAREISQMPLDMRLSHCRKHLHYFCPSLDQGKVDDAARLIIEKIGGLYKSPLSADLVVRLYIHCAAMFERVSTIEPIPMPLDGYAAVQHNIETFDVLRGVLNGCGKDLRLDIADAEVYYLMMTLPSAYYTLG